MPIVSENVQRIIDRVRGGLNPSSVRKLIERIRGNDGVEEISGGEIAPSIVISSPTSAKGKYKLAKSVYKNARKEHRSIVKDILKQTENGNLFYSDEQVKPILERIENAKDLYNARKEYVDAKDNYFSQVGGTNSPFAQLYRYYSRHYGPQSRKLAEDFQFGEGADIIDLSRNAVRLTPDSRQSTALFNDFVESTNPSVRKASEYKENPDMIIGDRFKFPARDISIFGGIEDGKFKLDSLKNFNDSTTVIPARNIKAGTPMISEIQVVPKQEEESGPEQRSKQFLLNTLAAHSSSNPYSALKRLGDNEYAREVALTQAMRAEETNDFLERQGLARETALDEQAEAFRNYAETGEFPSGKNAPLVSVLAGLVDRKYPGVLPYVHRSNWPVYYNQNNNSKGKFQYNFTDSESNSYPISTYNASILDGKTVIGNPSGSIFVGRMQDISQDQLKELNRYLKDNPSWILRTDLGSFDQYDLNNPTLKTYLKQYFEHPDQNDPNVYTIGTTTPNKFSYSEGGGIHIKPSHRGRLTELKERTGKTEAELYNDGNPAHKKMVVFARNARQWRHPFGGLLSRYPKPGTVIPVKPSGYSGGNIPEEPGGGSRGVYIPPDYEKMKLKQRYAESKFNDKASSKAGAVGAWQIMPITLKDYLGRGKGKEGDLTDPAYNEIVRDWVMGTIPKDLKEYWSDEDTEMNKLAKLYAAYNMGAGSLKKYFKKREADELGIDDPYDWVEGLNPETKRYVKYIVFDKDFDEKSGYTTKQFEDAAKKGGYMDEDGKVHRFDNGGPYGVTPLGGDLLEYYQSIPEIYGGGIEPAVATAPLPAKFNGSQEAASRYAEGYQKGAKPVSEAINRASEKIYNVADRIVGLTPTPAGAATWLGHMGADVANKEYGKVGKDLAMAALMGLGISGAKAGYGLLKNYYDDLFRFGEDTFSAFINPTSREMRLTSLPQLANEREASYYIGTPGTIMRHVTVDKLSPDDVRQLQKSYVRAYDYMTDPRRAEFEQRLENTARTLGYLKEGESMPFVRQPEHRGAPSIVVRPLSGSLNGQMDYVHNMISVSPDRIHSTTPIHESLHSMRIGETPSVDYTATLGEEAKKVVDKATAAKDLWYKKQDIAFNSDLRKKYKDASKAYFALRDLRGPSDPDVIKAQEIQQAAFEAWRKSKEAIESDDAFNAFKDASSEVQKYSHLFKRAESFRRKRAEALVDEYELLDNPKHYSYLTDPREAAVHPLSTGMHIGIEPFSEYPGDEKFDELYKKAVDANSNFKYYRHSTPNEKRWLWKAMTGTLLGGAGAAYMSSDNGEVNYKNVNKYGGILNKYGADAVKNAIKKLSEGK